MFRKPFIECECGCEEWYPREEMEKHGRRWYEPTHYLRLYPRDSREMVCECGCGESFPAYEMVRRGEGKQVEWLYISHFQDVYPDETYRMTREGINVATTTPERESV